MCRTPYPGGAPANVAAALGKLGTKVGFITAFGNDELAEKMKKLLESMLLSIPYKVLSMLGFKMCLYLIYAVNQ